jgi:hypothetical protein
MKVCIKCKEELSLDNFYKSNGVIYSMCNPCKSKHNKKVYAKKKELLRKSQW